MTHQEFEHAELQARRAEAERPYLEFLRSETFELGLYELAAGSDDGQKPHDEDEIYVVMSGRGRFAVAGDDVAVGPGSVLFVAKHTVHRFHTIEEDLSIVVAFSPPRPAEMSDVLRLAASFFLVVVGLSLAYALVRAARTLDHMTARDRPYGG